MFTRSHGQVDSSSDDDNRNFGQRQDDNEGEEEEDNEHHLPFVMGSPLALPFVPPFVQDQNQQQQQPRGQQQQFQPQQQALPQPAALLPPFHGGYPAPLGGDPINPPPAAIPYYALPAAAIP